MALISELFNPTAKCAVPTVICTICTIFNKEVNHINVSISCVCNLKMGHKNCNHPNTELSFKYY